jgi:hypothetical protein
MKAIIALVGAVLASTLTMDPGSSLAPVLIWSAVGIWMAVAFVLAAVVAVLTRPVPRRPAPARVTWTGNAPHRLCTACVC